MARRVKEHGSLSSASTEEEATFARTRNEDTEKGGSKLLPGDPLSVREKEDSIRRYENICSSFEQRRCQQCRCVSLDLEMADSNTCGDCHGRAATGDYWISQNLLPVWYDSNGSPVYTVPEELNDLTAAEKALIQMCHIYRPMHFVAGAAVDGSGNICENPLSLGEVCTTLPRLPGDLHPLKFVELHLTEIESGESAEKLYAVRKNTIIRALRWLKRHNTVYRDVDISLDNLAWIKGSESVLPVEQSLIDTAELDSIPSVSEYGEGSKVFARAFPWLFPGGCCDFADCRSEKVSASQWAKRMLMYEDGRFAQDEVFCFCAVNFAVHRDSLSASASDRNNLSEWGCLRGDRLFADSAAGSYEYWRIRSGELRAWIHHHVLYGNGRPDIIFTLSCGETWWPDVRRLVEDRVEIATGMRPDLSRFNTIRPIGEWSSVIQECFRAKVMAWLDEVGKTVFGIRHYWIRYDYGPTPGQLSARIVAITDSKKIQSDICREAHDESAQARLFFSWAANKFSLAAPKHGPVEVGSDSDGSKLSEARFKRFRDIPLESSDSDADQLMAEFASHYRSYPNRSIRAPSCCYLRDRLPVSGTPCIATCGVRLLNIAVQDGLAQPVSLDLIRTWRADCDMKLLVYDSHPVRQDPEEMKGVTDFIAWNMCASPKRDKIINAVLALHEKIKEKQLRCGRNGRNCTHELLKQARWGRELSKQECIALLLGLHLVNCSDVFVRYQHRRHSFSWARSEQAECKGRDDADEYMERVD